MPLSRGARALLAFLQSKVNFDGVCWWSQPRISEATGYGVRSIGRYIAELSAAGSLEKIRRAARSSVYKPVQKPAENSNSIRPKWPNDSAKMAEASIEVNFKEKKIPRDGFDFPEEFVQNQHGLREPNPDWAVAQAALRRASKYSHKASDPAAYERAAVRNALQRKPNGKVAAS